MVGLDPYRGSTSRRRASGRGTHGDDRGGGDAGAEDGRAGEGDDGDANLPQLGPQGPPDPPVRSLPELACPLSPSPLAHCELQQTEIEAVECRYFHFELHISGLLSIESARKNFLNHA